MATICYGGEFVKAVAIKSKCYDIVRVDVEDSVDGYYSTYQGFNKTRDIGTS